jgi:hypothetical protein
MHPDLSYTKNISSKLNRLILNRMKCTPRFPKNVIRMAIIEKSFDRIHWPSTRQRTLGPAWGAKAKHVGATAIAPRMKAIPRAILVQVSVV